ncbi:MAG: FadR family transcriptional regulator [Devosia sp.]|nr:FadR family transcriptional regulator [Devosia sp.]
MVSVNDTGTVMTAAGTVADRLTALILRELQPGASLPSEAELADRFEVSRLTVREAVKMLVGRGLLDLGRGRRAIVREPDGTVFGEFLTMLISHDPKSLFDLVEVRLGLEVQSATLASRRITRAGLAGLEATLRGMRETAQSIREHGETEALEHTFHQHDMAFHEALALASGNRVLTFLFEAMSSSLITGFYISRRGHVMRGHSLEDTVEAHQRILDSVGSGNGRAAADAMRAHLKDTERDVRAAVETLSRPPSQVPV